MVLQFFYFIGENQTSYGKFTNIFVMREIDH